MTEEIQANRRKSDEKRRTGQHDVLLSYNRKDKEQVKNIEQLLIDNGIAPWRDEWDIRPGVLWMTELEQKIEEVKIAVIVLGKDGFGAWQKMERLALLNEFVERGCIVVPVILEDAPSDVKLPPFLKIINIVDFRQRDPDPLEQLLYGIIGTRPTKVYRPGVLIASLGDSPAVVPAMYDLLTQQRRLTLDRVVVIHPGGDDIQDAYTQVKQTLSNDVLVVSEDFKFEDADSQEHSQAFLQRLYKLLDSYERQGESVYLSLAGGRKSMAALMAWVVPFFSCIKGLYHVIEKDKDRFPSLHEIQQRMSSAQRAQAMRPQLDHLTLVEIPTESGQQISKALHEKLLGNLPSDFERYEDVEQAEAIITGQTIMQDAASPQLRMTDLSLKQFHALCQRDLSQAQKLHRDLSAMYQWAMLRTWAEASTTYNYKAPKFPRTMLRLPSGFPSPIRPVFYTIPESESLTSPVEQIVICSLEEPGSNGEYRSIKEVATSLDFSLRVKDGLPSVPSPADSILIVPLGKSPMVATQLYTLLKECEQRTIHEVVLLYPQNSTEIHNAARMVSDVLKRTGDMVLCTLAAVPELEDIACKKDCIDYQQCLEGEITRVRQMYPDCKIDLALSGGRKGMTAMTIFAAQNQHIPCVFHTLIKDEALREEIEEQTTVKALNQQPYKRDERLLLRDPAYRDGETSPYEKFGLFRVPVFPANG